MTTNAQRCLHCERDITFDNDDGWVDPEATGDDSMWREVCAANDSFIAYHDPTPPTDPPFPATHAARGGAAHTVTSPHCPPVSRRYFARARITITAGRSLPSDTSTRSLASMAKTAAGVTAVALTY